MPATMPMKDQAGATGGATSASSPGPATTAVATGGAMTPENVPDYSGGAGVMDQTPSVGPRRGLGSFWAGSRDAT